MVRTQLEALISDKSGGRRTLRKDLDAGILQQIETFHRQSFYWTYLLNLAGKLNTWNATFQRLWVPELLVPMDFFNQVTYKVLCCMAFFFIHVYQDCV